ncbi:MAG: transposase [Patescibacteria group bacterium]
MRHGVEYGLKKAVVALEEGQEILLDSSEKKLDFVSKISEKDEFYLPFGSGADKFALACAKKGAKIFRIPTAKLAELRKGKSGEYAQLLLETAQNSPEFFYSIQGKDIKILEVGMLLQQYYIVQKEIRMKAQQRLFAALEDDFLVRGEPVAELEKELRREIAEHPMFAPALKEEKRLYRAIDKAVKDLPIYQSLFKPIKGVGAVIAGRIIYGIQDIRRFPNEAHLKNYAGYGFSGNNQIQKRRKGEVASWNNFLKQGIFLFTDQVNRRSNCLPWNKMLIERKEYERQKFPDISKGHIHAKACRYLGQKFLEYIFRKWRKF